MMQIKHIHDFWGIGIFWSVIEVLREQPEYKFSASESGLGLLCGLVMCSDKIRFQNWFNDCLSIGLFKIDENTFFSPSLCERMGNWESKKLNGSKGGRPLKTESKAKVKPNQKRNETIREEKRREEERRKEKKIQGLAEREKLFYEKVAAFKERYTPEMLRSFYDYWTEHSDNGLKMRFEKQPVFDLAKRLATWANKEHRFGKKEEPQGPVKFLP